MSEFYKMNPSAWDFGTAGLSLEEEAAYLRIVNAINKHDAPVPNNDRVLAGMFRTSTRKARSLLNALVEAGKVYVEEDQIWNSRARSEVVQRQLARISNAESGAKGGRTRAENAAKALKSNETGQATASTRIEENRREEKEEPDGSSKKRASRLPRDWQLPKPWGEWSVSEGLSDGDTRFEADKFRDYWTAKAGRDASKMDWEATWRNWVRKAIVDRAGGGARASPQGSRIDKWNRIAQRA